MKPKIRSFETGRNEAGTVPNQEPSPCNHSTTLSRVLVSIVTLSLRHSVPALILFSNRSMILAAIVLESLPSTSRHSEGDENFMNEYLSALISETRYPRSPYVLFHIFAFNGDEKAFIDI